MIVLLDRYTVKHNIRSYRKMAPQKTKDVGQKQRKIGIKKRRSCNKKGRIYKSEINYGPYFCKLLKQIHPDLVLSLKAVNILNSFASDIFERIAKEAAIVTKYANIKTLSSREVQTGVRLVLPSGLLPQATARATKAVVDYFGVTK